MIDYFGCHVSVAGGLENGLKNAKTLGVNAIQVHPSPPQRWNANPFKPGHEEKYLAMRNESGVEKVFFHAIYLINLATPNPAQLEQSKKSLVYYLELASRVEADGVIVHVGSLKDQEDRDAAYRQVIAAIEWILGKSPHNSRLLLEVSAGGGKVIGAAFEDLREIAAGVGDKERLGFALDTQHMWASGYDIRGNLDGVLKQIKENFGFDRIGAVHLNDSMTDLASRRDRHANLGEGAIGAQALRAFMSQKGFRKIPFILETPALKDMESAAKEVGVLRGMVRG